jgi:hypothetical protein
MVPEIEHLHGQTHIGGLNRVFHCNYYNAYLQTAVLLSEGVGACQPRTLLRDAVIPLVHHLRHERGYSTRDLCEEFAYCGFGKLRRATDTKWLTPTSHYGQAALLQGQGECSCFFNVGYLMGITDRLFRETSCKQQGSPIDWYEGGVDPAPEVRPYLERPPEFFDEPGRFDFAGAQAFDTAVDEGVIQEAVSGLPLYGKSGVDDTGLIDAFGVVLTNHFADYYNYISYESYFGMLKGGVPKAQARDVFVQGGHICAFNTFGGIMSSPEWYAVVEPMCRDAVDWIHGMVAIINALGWGVWRVEKIVPGRELIMRIYNSYEGVGYRRMYPLAKDVELSFLNMGAVQGLAHLLWKIDIRERPELTQAFYAEVFNDPRNSFSVTQTHAIAAGHNCDRIVVTRN